MGNSVIQQMMDDHTSSIRRGLAQSFVPGAIPHQAREEPGLIDVSAFIPARAGVKGMMSTKYGDNIKRIVPDPALWKATRKAKNNVHNYGLGAGGALGLAESAYENIRTK